MGPIAMIVRKWDRDSTLCVPFNLARELAGRLVVSGSRLGAEAAME